MLEEETLEGLLLHDDIATPSTAPICPICSTSLIEDWSEEIDKDGEIVEHEIYACEECGFQEPI